MGSIGLFLVASVILAVVSLVLLAFAIARKRIMTANLGAGILVASVVTTAFSIIVVMAEFVFFDFSDALDVAVFVFPLVLTTAVTLLIAVRHRS